MTGKDLVANGWGGHHSRPPSMPEKGDWAAYDQAGAEGDEMVIYDRENPDAWVQSDVTWDEIDDGF